MTARIVIRHITDCPGLGLLQQRLAGLAAEDEVALELIATPDDAARIDFYGSPTILIDGTDPFPIAASSPGLSCRLYRTEHGAELAPSASQLRKALTATP